MTLLHRLADRIPFRNPFRDGRNKVDVKDGSEEHCVEHDREQ